MVEKVESFSRNEFSHKIETQSSFKGDFSITLFEFFFKKFQIM